MAGIEKTDIAYETIVVLHISPNVVEVRLNRPEIRNAMNTRLWKEVGHCFSELIPNEKSCRCVLLTGAGPTFSAGVDFKDGPIGQIIDQKHDDVARQAVTIQSGGRVWQQAWLAISSCKKPVIACIQGGCFGVALEMVAFADIRFCTADAIFQAPQVKLGLAADVGGNQQLPKIIGNDSLLRELMLSGRRLSAAEALTFGLVSRVLPDQDALMRAASELATEIATNSPMATLGVKTLLNYTRSHSVEDSLEYAITWNGSMVQTEDVGKAGMAFMTKQIPSFVDAPPLTDRSKL